ncbi:MAG: hypothetical protein O7A68_02140, partial [Alphaproteobacteria bacterium]|nr:hypothetical protein [Alphaproteobacteria bacterium]
SYGGRIFKLMGDGMLAEFPSVVDAVQCAVVVQGARSPGIALRPRQWGPSGPAGRPARPRRRGPLGPLP